jgi:hypothetical protein
MEKVKNKYKCEGGRERELRLKERKGKEEKA